MRNIIVSLMFAGVLVASPLATSALASTDVQSQITSLMEQIKTLQMRLADLLKLQPVSSPTESATSSARPHRICALLNRNLSQGTRGDDVSGLQEFLNEQGYLSATATGFFGPMTTQAVAKWQASQGVSSVGSVGPMTRERIKTWCGKPIPTGQCKPINYRPIACADGSQSQPVQDSRGCTVRHECPVANFTPPANCKAWNDGCNICSRTSPDAPVMCTQRACFAAGKGYCTAYFDETSDNKPPIISSVSGPTTLAINRSGTWAIRATDPENGTLTYSVTWGDESAPSALGAQSNTMMAFVQTGTFTHSYASAGVYTVTFIVQDSAGASAQSTLTVTVASSGGVCTMEYAPVCGQPPEPACSRSTPACMMATPGPTTYSNRCVMNAAGATFLYDGQCVITY